MLLFSRREVFGHVDLTQRLAHLAVYAAGASLPALLLLLSSIEDMRIEMPRLLFKAFRHAGACETLQQMPAQISLDLFKRGVGHQGVERSEELWLSVVHLACGGCARCGHILRQRKVGQLLRKACDIGGMVQVLRVALLGN